MAVIEATITPPTGVIQSTIAPRTGSIQVNETPSQTSSINGETYVEYCSNTDPVSPRMSYVDGQFKVMRKWEVRFLAVDAVIPRILGYPIIKENGALSRVVPRRDPQFPNLVATDILDISPVGVFQQTGFGTARNNPLPEQYVDGDFGRFNRYARARITIEFSRPHYWVRDDQHTSLPSDTDNREFNRFVEVHTALEGQYLHMRALQGLLKFGSGQTGIGTQAGAKIQESIGKIIAQSNVSMTWHQVPYAALSFDRIKDGIGKINKAAFGDSSDPARYWAAHTLLCMGAHIEPITLANYEFGWKVTYIFKELRTKWNYFYTPRPALPGGGSGTAGFYQATIDGTFYAAGSLPDNKSVYDEYDYRKFFTPVGITPA